MKLISLLVILVVVLIIFILFFNIKSQFSSGISRKINGAFIINLVDRPDKLALALKSLKDFPDVSRTPGIRVNKGDYTTYRAPGEIGCSLAHLNILKKISRLPSRDKQDVELWYFVFEDDVISRNVNSFQLAEEILNDAPEKAWGINFGPCTYGDSPSLLKKFGKFSTCSHAIAYTPEGASEASKAIKNRFLKSPLDNILSHDDNFKKHAYNAPIIGKELPSFTIPKKGYIRHHRSLFGQLRGSISRSDIIKN
tara:strand:- start:1178 stop:1936 length:759 start_codon:yes stop_codon:yes gene_type:complete